MILSILIPTTPDRDRPTANLCNEFIRQIDQAWGYEKLNYRVSKTDAGETITVMSKHGIEIICYRDNKEISIGEKRDRLYKMAKGEYSVQWDSDDWVAPLAITKIIAALFSKPDCVTYQEDCTINGQKFVSNHSIRYADWEGDGSKILEDGFHYHRTPFMKSVIRTDYCKHIGVADMRYSEDIDFARLIKPMLVKEVHIDQYLYLYNHESTDHNERYGIKN